MIAQSTPVMLVGWDVVQTFGSSCGKTTSLSEDLDAAIASMMFFGTNISFEEKPFVPLYRPPPLSSHSRQQFHQRRPAASVRIPPRRNRNLHIQ